MKLTPKEKAAVLKMRQEEEDQLPFMEGTLKENLYYIPGTTSRITIDLSSADSHCFFTKEGFDKAIQDVKDSFELCLPKGTRFVAFKYDWMGEEGKVYWFDDIGWGAEELPQEWADKFLENIKPIKRKKA